MKRCVSCLIYYLKPFFSLQLGLESAGASGPHNKGDHDQAAGNPVEKLTILGCNLLLISEDHNIAGLLEERKTKRASVQQCKKYNFSIMYYKCSIKLCKLQRTIS